MLSTNEIAIVWKTAFNEYQNNEDDPRKIHDVVIDFTSEVLKSEVNPLITALKNNCRLFVVQLNDPLIPKDHKNYIRECLDKTQALIKGTEAVKC